MTGKRLHGDVKQWPHGSPVSHATLYRSHLQAAAGLDIFSGNRFDCDKNSFRLRPDLVWRLYAPKPLHCILKQFCASYTGTWNYHKFGLSKHPFKSISKVCLEFCIWFLLKDAWCIEAWVSLQSTCKFLSHCKNRKKRTKVEPAQDDLSIPIYCTLQYFPRDGTPKDSTLRPHTQQIQH